MNGNRVSCIMALLIAVTSGLGPSSVEAQPRRRREPREAAPAEPVDDSTARAREAYDRGRSLFTSGEYQEALASFQTAYEAKPHPTVLISIAECQERLNDYRAAVETLEHYLHDSPEARDRAQVEARITAHRARPAKLNITSEPTGASISVDGEDSGQTTPYELEVPPGDHDVRLRLDGYSDATQEVTVEFAERRDLPMSLEASSGGDQADQGDEGGPVEETRTEGSSAPIWIAGGITGVALVTGSVLGFLALSDKSDFDDDPTADVADRGERFALLADISFGVALAAGATTVVLALTRHSTAEESEDDESSDPEALQLQLAPLVARNGGGLAAHLRF